VGAVVNVPIGILVAAAAPRVMAESPRRPGRIDVAGAVTGTGGVALLVYGLSKTATGADGVSHWGDAQVLASLTAAVVLLVSFLLIERRSSHPLLPMRVLADRNRSGAYGIGGVSGQESYRDQNDKEADRQRWCRD